MFAPRKDDTWPISIICLCLIVWLWLTGCAGTRVEPELTAKTEEVHKEMKDRGLNSPRFDTIHMPMPWVSNICEGLTYGYIDDHKRVLVWGLISKDKVVWPLMIRTTAGNEFERAWVDTDLDGKYDELYTQKERAIFLAKYPDPCVLFLQKEKNYY